jgi:hypothetical protein
MVVVMNDDSGGCDSDGCDNDGDDDGGVGNNQIVYDRINIDD